MKTRVKTNLDKFRVDFQKLIAKYPDIRVFGDMNGEACAYDVSKTNQNIVLPRSSSDS